MTNKEAALEYLKRNWYVIPLCWPTPEGRCGCGRDHKDRQIGKAALIKEWEKSRCTSKDIDRWWGNWPEANIGILLEPSGLVVVDADGPGAVEEVGILQTGKPKTFTVATGQGLHHYFQWNGNPTRLIQKGTSGKIDILSAGYAIAPPSTHRTGRTYKILVGTDPGEAPQWVTEYLTNVPPLPSPGGETPPWDTGIAGGGDSFSDILSRNRKRIVPKVYRELINPRPEEGKRSTVLFWLEHELLKSGISAQDVYTLVKGSAWNKYRGRKDEDIRLKEEISRAVGDEVVDKPSLPNKEEPVQMGLRLETFKDVMYNSQSDPGWLVEGFWTRGSHGFVAGEPKTFKSTLMLDMAVSIASGEPFLGKFRVVKKGPVLIIQNENADWIMKDRLMKIAHSRGLGGSIDVIGKGRYNVVWPNNLPIHFINQQSYNLQDPIHKEVLEAVIKEIHPVLIVLDPLYLMFDGDVNSAKELNPVLSWLLEIKQKYDTGIMLIHHMKKSNAKAGDVRGGQRMLGSTTLHGWSESALYMSVPSTVEEVADSLSDDDINKPVASQPVYVEREFRGAGAYPRSEINISMGEFGSLTYSATIGAVKGKSEVGKTTDENRIESIKEDMMTILSLYPEGMSMTRLAKEAGTTKYLAKRILEGLEGSEVVSKEGAVYKLA